MVVVFFFFYHVNMVFSVTKHADAFQPQSIAMTSCNICQYLFDNKSNLVAKTPKYWVTEYAHPNRYNMYTCHFHEYEMHFITFYNIFVYRCRCMCLRIVFERSISLTQNKWLCITWQKKINFEHAFNKTNEISNSRTTIVEHMTGLS